MKIFDNNGMVKLAVKPDKPVKFEKMTPEEQRDIDFCLNCKKKKCNGYCAEFRRRGETFED